MKWLEHIEALVLIFAPIAGMIALVSDFSWSNLIMFSILMLVWKIGNGAL
jgi:hypothetical protein